MRLWDVLRNRNGKTISAETDTSEKTATTQSIEDQFIEVVTKSLETSCSRERGKFGPAHEILYNDICSVEVTDTRLRTYEYVVDEARHYTYKKNDRIDKLLIAMQDKELSEAKARQLAEIQKALAKFNT